jgi:hypothetical protein
MKELKLRQMAPAERKSRAESFDRYLEREWNITLAPDGAEAWDQILEERLGREAYRKYKRRRDEPTSFWNSLAKPPFGTWFHSTRRAYIMDGTLCVHRIAEEMHTAGKMLELGAGAGCSSVWLARSLPNWSILATDASPGMVEAGKARREANLDWERLIVPHGEIQGTFDLIFGLHLNLALQELYELPAWIAPHLAPQAKFVILGDIPVDDYWLNRRLRDAGLGYKHFELAGGVLGGAKHTECDTIHVFENGANGDIPSTLSERIEELRQSFMTYANRKGGTREQANFSYMREWLNQQSSLPPSL